jgi:peroxiredoxin
MQQILESGGRVVPDYQGNQTWVMPIPATFVVDRDGVVTARFIDPDYRNRMTIEALLAALQAALSADNQGQRP